MPLRVRVARKIVLGKRTAAAKILTVPYLPQDQTEWCWAACTNMVLRYYGTVNVNQCDLVDWLYALIGCCQAGACSQCNKPCAFADVDKLYVHWKRASTYHASDVSFATLQAELNADRPVEVAFKWGPGNYHVAIVRGWDSPASGSIVAINDPYYGTGTVTYADLKVAYGYGSWDHTWTGIM